MGTLYRVGRKLRIEERPRRVLDPRRMVRLDGVRERFAVNLAGFRMPDNYGENDRPDFSDTVT
jgi:hypothetical protein